MTKKTYMQSASQVTREWHLIDARDQVLGRLASRVAQLLIGKHKKTYTPHLDGGDYVVVINAQHLAVTGSKLESKLYHRHSGHPGNLKTVSLGEMMAQSPARVLEKAVYNMLPKNKLRSPRMNRLKVYAGADHPHHSQLTAGNQDKS